MKLLVFTLLTALILMGCVKQQPEQIIPEQKTEKLAEQNIAHQEEVIETSEAIKQTKAIPINANNSPDNDEIVLYFMTDTEGEYYQRIKPFSRPSTDKNISATEILKMLFSGPDSTEKVQGAVDNPYNVGEYFISVAVYKEIELASIFDKNYVAHNVAIVDFAQPAEEYLCRGELGIQAAAGNPIRKSLMELPSVKEVIFTIEGKPMGVCDV